MAGRRLPDNYDNGLVQFHADGSVQLLGAIDLGEQTVRDVGFEHGKFDFYVKNDRRELRIKHAEHGLTRFVYVKGSWYEVVPDPVEPKKAPATKPAAAVPAPAAPPSPPVIEAEAVEMADAPKRPPAISKKMLWVGGAVAGGVVVFGGGLMLVLLLFLIGSKSSSRVVVDKGVAALHSDGTITLKVGESAGVTRVVGQVADDSASIDVSSTGTRTTVKIRDLKGMERTYDGCVGWGEGWMVSRQYDYVKNQIVPTKDMQLKGDHDLGFAVFHGDGTLTLRAGDGPANARLNNEHLRDLVVSGTRVDVHREQGELLIGFRHRDGTRELFANNKGRWDAKPVSDVSSGVAVASGNQRLSSPMGSGGPPPGTGAAGDDAAPLLFFPNVQKAEDILSYIRLSDEEIRLQAMEAEATAEELRDWVARRETYRRLASVSEEELKRMSIPAERVQEVLDIRVAYAQLMDERRKGEASGPPPATGAGELANSPAAKWVKARVAALSGWLTSQEHRAEVAAVLQDLWSRPVRCASDKEYAELKAAVNRAYWYVEAAVPFMEYHDRKFVSAAQETSKLEEFLEYEEIPKRLAPSVDTIRLWSRSQGAVLWAGFQAGGYSETTEFVYEQYELNETFIPPPGTTILYLGPTQEGSVFRTPPSSRPYNYADLYVHVVRLRAIESTLSYMVEHDDLLADIVKALPENTELYLACVDGQGTKPFPPGKRTVPVDYGPQYSGSRSSFVLPALQDQPKQPDLPTPLPPPWKSVDDDVIFLSRLLEPQLKVAAEKLARTKGQQESRSALEISRALIPFELRRKPWTRQSLKIPAEVLGEKRQRTAEEFEREKKLRRAMREPGYLDWTIKENKLRAAGYIEAVIAYKKKEHDAQYFGTKPPTAEEWERVKNEQIKAWLDSSEKKRRKFGYDGAALEEKMRAYEAQLRQKYASPGSFDG